MLYQHLTDACFEEQSGSCGVSRKRVQALLSPLAETFAALTGRDGEAGALLDMPFRTDDLEAIEKLAAAIRASYDTVIVAGAGGSGLSGRALACLAPGSVPALHFLENIDPDIMEALLARIDCRKTCFLIISKSGATAETLAQFLVLFDYAVDRLGRKAAGERFFIVTMPGENPLRRLAAAHGLQVLDHDAVGGRFAALTKVGLLPAAIAGLDIRALRRGAGTVVEQMDEASQPQACPAALGAALNVAFMEKNIAMSVMFPYSERLVGFSAWWRQGWAESLGKQGRGSTPVCALGTTDQHSQLQLYLDGPKDKLFHMVMIERQGKGRRVAAAGDELSYLQGKTLGDIMAAEQKATFETLLRHGCPVRLFRLPLLAEEQLGALLMHVMLEIIFAARLLGVNPFDQPAVEEGKKLARDYLLAGKL